MANLSLTLQCNRRCAYCFARPLEAVVRPSFVSPEAYAATLDFLQASGIDEVRLLGGEPTLHPQFLPFVQTALDRGLRVAVFSNGLMSEDVAATLADAADGRVAVLVNVHPSAVEDGDEGRRLRKTLALLGPRAQVGHNIVDPTARLDFLLDLIDSFHLRRAIRLGLAHPCVGADNAYLSPKRYAVAGQTVAAFGTRARRRDVRLEPDCGLVPCMFPEGALDATFGPGQEVGRQCGPVPDILPDGSVIACYPLASVWRLRLRDYATAAQVRGALEALARPLRTIGIFAHCRDCARRADGSCLGGCLAAVSTRLRGAAWAGSTA
jgi:hypothetical protein